MFFEYKLRKAFSECNVPDYTDRIPALAMLSEIRHKHAKMRRRKILLCAATAVFLLISAMAVYFYGAL